MNNPIRSLINSLANQATKARQPLAITIPGWTHDLITQKLRNRGVVFTMRNKYGPEADEEGTNKEGRWIVKTERLGPTPHSVILFQPATCPDYKEKKPIFKI